MGYTSKKAHDLVYGGGLKIYTAIDFDVQDSMEDVYENYRRMPDETVQGAMVVMVKRICRKWATQVKRRMTLFTAAA